MESRGHGESAITEKFALDVYYGSRRTLLADFVGVQVDRSRDDKEWPGRGLRRMRRSELKNCRAAEDDSGNGRAARGFARISEYGRGDTFLQTWDVFLLLSCRKRYNKFRLSSVVRGSFVAGPIILLTPRIIQILFLLSRVHKHHQEQSCVC